MNWERLREKVLEENYPPEEELVRARKLYEKIDKYIDEEFGLDTYFAGSTGRGTCMSGDKDIDIFVSFPKEIDRSDLEEKGIRVGKKVFNNFNGEYRIEFAEHPYTKGQIEGHQIEIVPCYETDPSDIKSSVDRTPHHIRWVDNHLDKKKKEEVVLLKKFLKEQSLYGSSLKVEGFSGYLCEVLIVKYGSFRNLLQNAIEWDEKEIIDIEDHHKEDLPKNLKKQFSEKGLILIDPVDPERNVSSVLNFENYSKFIYFSWLFEKNPGIHFFRKDEREIQNIELKRELEKRSDILVLEFPKPNIVEDIIYPQIRKSHKRLKNLLTGKDFRIYNSGVYVGEKCRIWFELDLELPKITEKAGPKVFHPKKHLEQFKEKYNNVFVEDDRLKAKTERNIVNAKHLLKNFLERDREKLQEKGIPKHVSEEMVNYKFIDPLKQEEKWLKYLAEKFNLKQNE